MEELWHRAKELARQRTRDVFAEVCVSGLGVHYVDIPAAGRKSTRGSGASLEVALADAIRRCEAEDARGDRDNAACDAAQNAERSAAQ